MNYKIRIENIVASGSLGIQVPLQKIVSKVEGTEYEPEQFPGLVLRMNNPKSAALIFSSGKIVCTGTRTQKDLKKALKRIVSVLRSSSIKVPSKFNFRIENIVSSTKLNARIDLDKVAFEMENSEYEPEQFPGLVLRFKNPNVAFLLFGSGKIVCTGARKTKDVKIAINRLVKELKSIGAIIKE